MPGNSTLVSAARPQSGGKRIRRVRRLVAPAAASGVRSFYREGCATLAFVRGVQDPRMEKTSTHPSTIAEVTSGCLFAFDQF
jgi:hypothetical protein